MCRRDSHFRCRRSRCRFLRLLLLRQLRLTATATTVPRECICHRRPSPLILALVTAGIITTITADITVEAITTMAAETTDTEITEADTTVADTTMDAAIVAGNL